MTEPTCPRHGHTNRDDCNYSSTVVDARAECWLASLPTRLTEAELARLLDMAKDHGGNLDVGVRALVEEVRRLRKDVAGATATMNALAKDATPLKLIDAIRIGTEARDAS